MEASFKTQLELSPETSVYKYRPFSATEGPFIRLATVAQPAIDRPIQIILEMVALANAPEYRALSYTWGYPLYEDPDNDPTDQSHRDQIVLCEGQILRITKNLHDALSILPSCAEFDHLWIDAICIDQGNIGERNAQVAIMSDIYRQASNVIVWLGPATQDTPRAITLMEKLSTISPMSAYHLDAPWLPGSWESLGLPSVEDSDLRSLALHLSRRWFSRIWVIQEIALASCIRVFCGKYQITWDMLEIVGNFLCESGWNSLLLSYLKRSRNDRRPLGDIATRLCGTTEIRKNVERDISLQSIIRSGRLYQATDPRDKVFALRGLLSIKENNKIEPDYSKSVREIYIQITRQILRDNESFDYLGCVEDNAGRKLTFLPSLVPDLTVLSHPVELRKAKDDGSNIFSASGRWCSNFLGVWDHSYTDDKLRITGFYLDDIVEVGPAVIDFQDPSQTTLFSQWYRPCRIFITMVSLGWLRSGEP